MNEQSRALLFKRYALYVKCATIISILVGIMVLFGYAFKMEELTSVTPFWQPMKSNMAICIILCSMSVWWLRSQSNIPRKSRIAAKTCAFVVLLFSILTFTEYLFGINLGIDQFLFHNKLTIDEIIYPGRTSVASTFSLFFLSFALVLIDKRRSTWLYQFFACIVIAIAFMGLLGYFYNINTVYGFTYFTKMPLLTSVVFILLGFALLLMRPNIGMIEELLKDSSGGETMRTLLPLTFVICTLVGFLENIGERINLFGPAFGDNIQLTATIVLLAGAIIINAKKLDREEAKRNKDKR